jgi:outer membrane protein OmpA-like peptidoglycan-associated protein
METTPVTFVVACGLIAGGGGGATSDGGTVARGRDQPAVAKAASRTAVAECDEYVRTVTRCIEAKMAGSKRADELTTAAQASLAAGAPQIPLREGLTIVTAVNNGTVDFESIKRVIRLDATSVTVTYSADAPRLDNQRQRIELTRMIRRHDLETAHEYQWDFRPGASETSAGRTAVGVSASVLEELNARGQTQLSVSSGATSGVLSGMLMRVERGTVPFKVIVNDVPVEVAAVHTRGRLGGEAAELWILDDVANPLALRWAIGNRRLQTIKVSYPVGQTTSARIERDLSKQGRAVLYGIYFEFASDRMTAESDPVMAQIASVLQENPSWSLAIEGHTDNLGGDAFNLDLSKRRAAAVKRALVGRYKVAPSRLQTNGYGASRPKDANDTLEGRARNRRVELMKVASPN